MAQAVEKDGEKRSEVPSRPYLCLFSRGCRRDFSLLLAKTIAISFHSLMSLTTKVGSFGFVTAGLASGFGQLFRTHVS